MSKRYDVVSRDGSSLTVEAKYFSITHDDLTFYDGKDDEIVVWVNREEVRYVRKAPQ